MPEDSIAHQELPTWMSKLASVFRISAREPMVSDHRGAVFRLHREAVKWVVPGVPLRVCFAKRSQTHLLALRARRKVN